jgi:hypothetical protein
LIFFVNLFQDEIQQHNVEIINELFAILDALKERIKKLQGIQRDLADAVVANLIS